MWFGMRQKQKLAQKQGRSPRAFKLDLVFIRDSRIRLVCICAPLSIMPISLVGKNHSIRNVNRLSLQKNGGINDLSTMTPPTTMTTN